MSTLASIARKAVSPVLASMTTLLMLGASAAHAAALTGQVTASLYSSSTTLDAADTVSVGPGIEISAGNGTNIGALMISGVTSPGGVTISEAINFQSLSIALRILAGAEDAQRRPVTGWGADARYEFSGLTLDTGTISGVSVIGSAADISNFSSLSSWVHWSSSTPGTILFDIDDIIFVDKSGVDWADITINLQVSTAPPDEGTVPAPGTVALVGLALAAAAAARRRSRPRS